MQDLQLIYRHTLHFKVMHSDSAEKSVHDIFSGMMFNYCIKFPEGSSRFLIEESSCQMLVTVSRVRNVSYPFNKILRKNDWLINWRLYMTFYLEDKESIKGSRVIKLKSLMTKEKLLSLMITTVFEENLSLSFFSFKC